MKRLALVVGVSLLCIGISGCGLKKDMDKMMDNTEDMKETTEQMKESTDHLSQRTEDALDALRLKFGAEEMENHFDKLLKTSSTTDKVDHAVNFFGAMDFQHWQGDYEDNQSKRDELIYQNVEQFYSKISSIVDDRLSVSTPLLRSHLRNNWKSLGALAVGMSKILPSQMERSKKNNFTPISFYDILATGLLQKDKYENGEEVPAWVVKVLEKEEVAVYLMQLRHNFFKGVILGEMTDFEDGMMDGMINKVGYSWFGSLVSINNFNKAKLTKWVELIWKARKTQELLLILGHPLEFNGILTKSFSRVEFADHINFPPEGIEVIENPMPTPGKPHSALYHPPILQQHFITLDSFGDDITINTLSPELQNIDVQTNFFIRFFDLQSSGLED